jgi:hypothetical protein
MFAACDGGGGFVDGPTTACRRRGSPREHQWGFGVTSGKAGGGGVYPSGGAAGRRTKSPGTAAFAGGEGAPAVVVACAEVQQLGKGKGVRKLQVIAMIRGSGRRSPGNGGRCRGSAGIRAREGLPVAGGGSPGAGRGGEGCGTRERGRRGVGDGGTDGV